MADIRHRVGIKSSVNEVYQALTTTEALAGWWTTGTSGTGSDVGGVLRFRFEAGGFDMKVLEIDPGQRVLWEVTDGPPEWIGTQVDWKLYQADEHAIVLFQHQGWREPVEFMHHCSTKWAYFLLGLKAGLEGGKATPSPEDMKISSWG